jgi:hypothetical protein
MPEQALERIPAASCGWMLTCSGGASSS